MREQCKGCLYFCDTPMLIGPHCHHINSAIVPGWWEVHPDGECPEYTDNEKMELINILRRNGFTIVMHGNNMWENRGKFFYINAIKK